MQMNYKIAGQFEHLYPKTLGANVMLNNGTTLEQWKQQIDDMFNAVEDDDFNVMWSGNNIMDAATELTMPKALSSCKNGWILVFGDTSGTGKSNWNYCYVPKNHAAMFDYTGGVKFLVGVKNSGITSKFIFISDTKIKGHLANTQNGNEGAALLKVISH